VRAILRPTSTRRGGQALLRDPRRHAGLARASTSRCWCRPSAAPTLPVTTGTANDITAQLFAPSGFSRSTPTTPQPTSSGRRDWPSTYASPLYGNMFGVGSAFAPPHPIRGADHPIRAPVHLPAPPPTGMPCGLMAASRAQHRCHEQIAARPADPTARSMAEMGAACVASAGAGLRNGSAAAMTMFPVVPDYAHLPSTRPQPTDTTGEIVAGWSLDQAHAPLPVIYKAKGRPAGSSSPSEDPAVTDQAPTQDDTPPLPRPSAVLAPVPDQPHLRRRHIGPALQLYRFRRHQPAHGQDGSPLAPALTPPRPHQSLPPAPKDPALPSPRHPREEPPCDFQLSDRPTGPPRPARVRSDPWGDSGVHRSPRQGRVRRLALVVSRSAPSHPGSRRPWRGQAGRPRVPSRSRRATSCSGSSPDCPAPPYRLSCTPTPDRS